jgi:hypothetical protein
MDTGQAITNELTKSYGFRYENGSWSWSVENIGKAFEEDPFWTTLDYALLALPVAKWGAAAYKVSALSRGTSAAKKLYESGRVVEAMGEATSFGGKAVEGVGRAFGLEQGLGRAAELEMFYGVPRTAAGRFVSSAAARRADDPDYLKMIDEVGGEQALTPMEKRGLHDVWARERDLEASRWLREGQQIAIEESRVLGSDEAMKGRYKQALESGLTPEVAQMYGWIGGPQVTELYRKSFDFRFKVHNGLYDLGLISKGAWESGIIHEPRAWAEWERLAQGAHNQGTNTTLGGRTENLKALKLTPDDVANLRELGLMSTVTDPAVSTMKMARAAMNIAGANYFLKLGKSAGIRSSDEVVGRLNELFGPAAKAGDAATEAAKALYNPDRVKDAFTTMMSSLAVKARTDPSAVLKGIEAIPESAKRVAIERLGWQSLDDLLAGAKAPGWLKRGVPDEMKGKFVDPSIARDVVGLVKMVQGQSDVVDAFVRVYQGGIGSFKYGKTILNPATHFRNILGAMVFHHLTVGGGGVLDTGMFRAGRRALAEGVGNVDFMEALRAGLIGSSEVTELRRHMANAIDDIDEAGEGLSGLLSKIPMVGNSWVMKKADQGMSRLEHFYRYVDELAKVDAFIVRRDAWIKKLGKEGFGDATKIRQEAISRATVDVTKFQPVFSQNSPLTAALRNVIPFSSFTTEAMRVWKNAMIEKPHLAFFWNHAVEALSHATGAIAGFSEEELAKAKESMPWFMHGKKTLTLPFRVDGKPVMLDMSYMIPLANMSEAAESEAGFFDVVGLDPFTNPFLSAGSVASTGIDPFTKKEVEPQFTERQLGIPLEPGSRTRRAVGLAEHSLKLLLPPLVPPGYAGVNLMELARGQAHPMSGAQLEEGVLRTVASNLAGLRVYEADVNSQALNVRREEQQLQKRVDGWWDKWRWGSANGDTALMKKAVDELAALRSMRGDSPEDALAYIEAGIKERAPGEFRTMTTRQMEEIVKRSQSLGYTDANDKKMLGALMARYQERTTNAQKKRRKEMGLER